MKSLRMLFSLSIFVTSFLTIAVNKSYANVADDLNANYNKVVSDCGTKNRPGFLCSGNILRMTSSSRKYHTWDPSPASIKRGGVSFFFLRKDILLKNLLTDSKANASGLIYYPSMQKPSWKGRAEGICNFATDGWSEHRPDSCGSTTYYPSNSQVCQQQGIYTADAWYKNFSSIKTYPDIFQHACGFDMSIGRQDTAAAFNESIKAHNLALEQAKVTYFEYGYDELVIKIWPTDANGKIIDPQLLPIQAFWYMNGGLADAQYFQQDYYNVTGIWIPIVKFTLTGDTYKTVQFSYSSTDQIVAGCSKN